MNIIQEIVNATKFLDGLSKGSGFPLEYTLVGSAGYLPAEKCHDVDFLVRAIKNSYLNLIPVLQNWGFQDCSGEEYPDEMFSALRKENLNLIVCDDSEFYARFVTAYTVCKALRLEKKYDRVLVHALVRDQMSMSDAADKALPWLEATVVPGPVTLVKSIKNNLLIENPGIDAFGRRQLWGAQA